MRVIHNLIHKQKLVNPQWTRPIPISRVLLGGPRVRTVNERKGTQQIKDWKKGGGGRPLAVGVGGFSKSEIDWMADEVWLDTGAATVRQGSAMIVEDLKVESGMMLNGTVIKSWVVSVKVPNLVENVRIRNINTVNKEY